MRRSTSTVRMEVTKSRPIAIGDDIAPYMVDRLFYSRIDKGYRRGGPDAYRRVADGIAGGFITFRRWDYTPIWSDADNPLDSLVGEQRRLWMECRRGGGWEHQDLKFHAALWLNALGDPDPEHEHNYLGTLRADLVSPPLGIVVECGNTDPDYLLAALREGWTRYAVFPFREGGYRSDLQWGSTFITMSLTAEGRDWLARTDREENDTLCARLTEVYSRMTFVPAPSGEGAEL